MPCDSSNPLIRWASGGWRAAWTFLIPGAAYRRRGKCAAGTRPCVASARRASCSYHVASRHLRGVHISNSSPPPTRKSLIDALLLKLPGVSARKINGLDAYFVSDKMFACISGEGIGLRLSAAAATELQFSRANVSAFTPAGVTSTREWIQINRADAADYKEDLALFEASITFVKAARSR
jgi:hypothetical protein